MASIDAAVKELKARRDALADELRKIDQALDVLAGLGGTVAPARTPGKWKPGGPGRPPKAHVEKRAPGNSATRPAKRRRKKRKPPSEKQLAAMAKAREALAAKRARAVG